MLRFQETSSILRVSFALSNRPQFTSLGANDRFIVDVDIAVRVSKQRTGLD